VIDGGWIGAATNKKIFILSQIKQIRRLNVHVAINYQNYVKMAERIVAIVWAT
jgi:hypothetical protein